MKELPIWIRDQLRKYNRRTVPILFDSDYVLKKLKPRDLNPELMELTVRFGRVVPDKCTEPDRLCFKHTHKVKGKKEDYFVVVACYPNFLRVVTGWK